MKVEFNDLLSQWVLIKDDVLFDLNNLFNKSNFILGDKVKEFEDKFSSFCNSKYSIGVSNGTDGLKLALRALASPEEKICIFLPANTFVATYIAAKDAFFNCDIFLVDCDEYFQIDTSLLQDLIFKFRNNYKKCFIIPVHLYGYTANMVEIAKIAERFECIVVEDASQAHGAISNTGNIVGNDSEAASFSLYPGKNLGAAGDAGIVTTNNILIYNKIKSLRNYGSEKKYYHNEFGYNCRLDTIQSIVLLHKLKFLEEWNEKRRSIVNRITTFVQNDYVKLPQKPSYCIKCVHHILPVLVKKRDNFIAYLTRNDIEHGIHYPIPITHMPFVNHDLYSYSPRTEEYSSKLVSLPIHPFLTEEKVNYVIDKLNNYNDKVDYA